MPGFFYSFYAVTKKQLKILSSKILGIQKGDLLLDSH